MCRPGETAKSRTTWGEAGPDQRSAGQRLLVRCRGDRAIHDRRSGLFFARRFTRRNQRNLKRLGLAHQEVFPLDYCTAFRRHASKSSNVARSMCYVHSARTQHPSSLRPNEHGPGRSGKLFRHLIGQPEAPSGRCPLGPEPPVMRHGDFMAGCQAQPRPQGLADARPAGPLAIQYERSLRILLAHEIDKRPNLRRRKSS